MFDTEIGMIADSLDHLTTKRGRRIIGLCLLGKGDGSGTLVVPNGLPREIYARRSDTRELFTLYLPPNATIAFQDGNASIETIEMRYGYETDNSRLQVLDALSSGGQQGIGTQSPIEQTIAEAYWTALDHITTLRAAPTSPVSTSINVTGPLWYARTSTSRYLFSSGTLSLSTQITALTSGQHQLAVIYLDTSTGSLGVLTNTAVTAAGTLPSRSEWAYTDVQAISIASGYIPIIVVYLYYGQASIAEADFYRTWDLRPLLGSGGAGSISGPGSSTDRAVVTWNGTGGAALRDNANATIDSTGKVTALAYKLPASTELTEATDAITVTQGFHTVKAETGTTDNLATINGGSGVLFVTLQAKSGHTITLKNGTGNIFLNGGADYALSGDKTILLFYDGTNWADVGIGSGGGLTSPLTTKGDVWGFSTVDARIPVGTDGQVLTADSTQTLGVKWSAAGSAVYPKRATMWHDEALVTVGGAYATSTNTSQLYNSYTSVSATAANGDTFTNGFMARAGTYTLYVLGFKVSDSGKIDWYVDNVSQFTGQDWYAGSNTNNVVLSGSITVASDGWHVLKGVINGKNASSSGYQARLTKYWIVPSAD